MRRYKAVVVESLFKILQAQNGDNQKHSASFIRIRISCAAVAQYRDGAAERVAERGPETHLKLHPRLGEDWRAIINHVQPLSQPATLHSLFLSLAATENVHGVPQTIAMLGLREVFLHLKDVIYVMTHFSF